MGLRGEGGIKNDPEKSDIIYAWFLMPIRMSSLLSISKNSYKWYSLFFSFPRFYFIGDDDLLQILGQASKPAVIQTHMKKLFAGIYNVNFDEENKHIVSMNSIEGESVPLKNKVRISNEVEHWLNELAKEMKGMFFSKLFI